jgi:hypothetical protein
LWRFVSNRNYQAWKYQPAQSTDRNKFAPLQSLFAPFPIPAWSTALAAVDQSVFVEFPNTVYAFPDPGLLMGPTKDGTKARFMETWVRSRDAWITRVAQEGSMAMKAQHWREFLITDLSDVSEVTNPSTKSGKRRQHVQDVLKEKLSFDSAVAPRCTIGEPIVWQGRSYPPGVLPPENIVRQILWELYELNFSQEFVSLDRRAGTNLDMRDMETLYARQHRFRSALFPTPSIMHPFQTPIADWLQRTSGTDFHIFVAWFKLWGLGRGPSPLPLISQNAPQD